MAVIILMSQPAYAANVQVTISSGASNTKGTCTPTDCFNPQVVNVNVGDTVTWTNQDTVGHTATSGKPSDNQTGTVFDSSLISAGKSYTSPAFNTPGTYYYFCQVHPWMTGEVIVGTGGGGASATNQAATGQTQGGTSATMTGTNMNLMVSPASFNPSSGGNVTLKFVPNPNVSTLVTDGTIKHLNYSITISQGGNTIFQQDFHAHNGNLTLVFTPSSGPTSVTGGMSNSDMSMTGPFYISGPVFNNSGSYDITAAVVEVNFKSISPLEDKFTVQAVPEFGQLATIVLAVSVIAIVAFTARGSLVKRSFV